MISKPKGVLAKAGDMCGACSRCLQLTLATWQVLVSLTGAYQNHT